MRLPAPGCVVLGLSGSVDSVDIELEKKQRSLHFAFLTENGIC